MWYITVIEKGEYSNNLNKRRYIMDPILWRTISHIAVFVASGLALMGGIGTWYFGNKVERIEKLIKDFPKILKKYLR